MFVSAGESGGLRVRSVLGFPPGANMAESPRRVVDERDGMGWTGVASAGASEEFGPIPGGIWGSDHLALGVEVALTTARGGR